MKSIWKHRNILAIGVVATVIATVGCSSTADDVSDTDSADQTPVSEELSLIALMAGTNNSYMQAARDSLIDTAKELDVQIDIKDAEWDPVKQQDQLDNAARSDKYDGILLWPVDPNPLCRGVEDAIGNGLAVAISNSPVCDGDPVMDGTVSFAGSQTFDTYDEWTAWVAEDAQSGKALVVTGSANDANTINMTKAMEKNFADFDIEIVVQQPSDYSLSDAFNIGSDVLQTHPEIDIVITNWSEATQGVVQAAEQLGRLDNLRIYDLGGNQWALDAIADGMVKMTYPLLPRLEAGKSIEALTTYLREGTKSGFLDLINDPSVPTQHFVTSENVQDHDPYF